MDSSPVSAKKKRRRGGKRGGKKHHHEGSDDGSVVANASGVDRPFIKATVGEKPALLADMPRKWPTAAVEDNAEPSSKSAIQPPVEVNYGKHAKEDKNDKNEKQDKQGALARRWHAKEASGAVVQANNAISQHAQRKQLTLAVEVFRGLVDRGEANAVRLSTRVLTPLQCLFLFLL